MPTLWMDILRELDYFWRSTPQVFLVFGRSGWIGGLVGELLVSQGAKFEFANARLEDRAGIMEDIERVRLEGRSENVSLFHPHNHLKALLRL